MTIEEEADENMTVGKRFILEVSKESFTWL